MASFFAFARSQRPADAWFPAGALSTYPEIPAGTRLAERQACEDKFVAGCRIFHVPRDDSSKANEVAIDDWNNTELGGVAKDQVMVFRYKGKMIAVNHECPHSSFPLSSGTTFDIEDFGMVLSSGIQCPKHDWSFDMFTGRSDRGSYKLNVWEVQLRPSKDSSDGTEEVWVRRKQKIG